MPGDHVDVFEKMMSRFGGVWVTAAFLCAVGVSHSVHAAAYATDGEGSYRNEILWLTWGGGVNGSHNVNLGNGSSSSANVNVAEGMNLNVTCTLADAGSASNSNNLRSYRPGTYWADALDDMYRIGGTGDANQLVVGIYTSQATKEFSVNCVSSLNGNPYEIPGLIMADAESLATGYGVDDPREFLAATAAGTWNVVEMYEGNGGSYYARKTNVSESRQQIFFGPGGESNGVSPAAVAALTFHPDAHRPLPGTVSMDFRMKGGGNTAMAIGLLVPKADFGDAPASYGVAAHLIPSLVALPDGLLADGSAMDINDGTFQLGALVPPRTGFLGSTGPDGESTSQHSENADGDDNNGSAGDKEEDAWPRNYELVADQVGAPLRQSVVCSGTGTVAGWIDFDRNGVFDDDERASASCSGGVAQLQWIIPEDSLAGKSYVRLRYATHESDVLLPTGTALDGEVEDHMITITTAADLRVTKTNTPSQGPNDLETDLYIPGENRTYTIVVTNEGPFGVQGITVSDPVPSGIEKSKVVWQCATTTLNATCGVPEGVNQSGDLLDNRLNLPVGGSATYTMSFEVPPTFTGNLVNTVEVDPPAAVRDPDLSNNTATDSDAPGGIDLGVVKGVEPAVAKVGDVVTYSILVTNAGPEAAINAVLKDQLPISGLDCLPEAVTPTCSVTGGAVCPSEGIDAGALTGETGVTLPQIPAGGSVTITLQCTVTGN